MQDDWIKWLLMIEFSENKLLCSCHQNSLSKQHSELSKSLTIENDDHWKIDDILNSRCYRDQIQYKMKWTELDWNDEWYYINKKEFDEFEEVLVEFHKLYSNKSH
jgi:hypothetical protein